MKTTYLLNNELHGVEIYFAEKPEENIRAELKANKFRWNGMKKCWYAKQTNATIALAERLAAGNVAAAEQIQQQAKVEKLTIEKMEEAAKAYSREETGEGMYAGWTGCNEHIVRRLSDQETKKLILKELKKNGIKATCRTAGNYMYTKYYFTVRVPEEFRMTAKEYADRQARNLGGAVTWDYLNRLTDMDGNTYTSDELDAMPYEAAKQITLEHWERYYITNNLTEPVEAFAEFVKAIVNSFNSDHSNSMIDYFERDFYTDYSWKAA